MLISSHATAGSCLCGPLPSALYSQSKGIRVAKFQPFRELNRKGGSAESTPSKSERLEEMEMTWPIL